MFVNIRPMTNRVVALALPSVVAFDLSIVAQVFGHRDEAARYTFTLCGPRAGPLASTTGFDFLVPAGLDALARADTLIVPGFYPLDDPDPAVLAALRAAHRAGARVASICTGAFALAAAGLLDDRPATTHWRNAAALAQRFPRVRVNDDVLYVDDGDILTSAGVAAGVDLCLHLVRVDLGACEASRIARRLVVAPHRAGGQAQFIERPVPTETGGGLSDTRAWALAHLTEPMTVAALARHAGWSLRSFARHFRDETGMTPQRWLVTQRVEEARRLLEGSDLSIEAVAQHTGFGTAATLRMHFSRLTSTTPTAYRAAFRGPARAPRDDLPASR